MNKEKTSARAFFLAACCFYIAAIFKFCAHDDTGMGIVWLGLGSTMQSLGAVWVNKMKKSAQSDEEE